MDEFSGMRSVCPLETQDQNGLQRIASEPHRRIGATGSSLLTTLCCCGGVCMPDDPGPDSPTS